MAEVDEKAEAKASGFEIDFKTGAHDQVAFFFVNDFHVLPLSFFVFFVLLWIQICARCAKVISIVVEAVYGDIFSDSLRLGRARFFVVKWSSKKRSVLCSVVCFRESTRASFHHPSPVSAPFHHTSPVTQ
jgi:hypothetical protein